MNDLPRFDDSAACVSIGIDPFFPTVDDDSVSARGRGRVTKAIAAICAGCPWHDPCYAYALHNDVHGIWAGTSAYQRDKTRTELGIKPIPVTIYHQPNRVIEDDAA